MLRFDMSYIPTMCLHSAETTRLSEGEKEKKKEKKTLKKKYNIKREVELWLNSESNELKIKRIHGLRVYCNHVQ